jgi:phosphatidylglycerol lysyltransferase
MRRPAEETEQARLLILEYGWNSTCYQLLNEGIEHWWSSDGRALVGFVRSGRMAIVAGAPVCSEESLSKTVREWERFVSDEGLRVCYFGAEARLQANLANSPDYVPVTLGSQPEWRPEEFVEAIESNRSLRAQLSRAANKGVVVSEWRREKAENSRELAAVLGEWLGARGLPTLHFLVEPDTLGNLLDRRLFVAEIQGRPVGFVTLCPIPAQSGWLTEQFVRSTRAPNGTVELMLYEAAKAVFLENASYFTMGIVPLISLEDVTTLQEPIWLRFLRRWAKAHYTRFYNFRGLSEFKTKFRPSQWRPVVVIVKDSRFRMRHLRAIGGAFTQKIPEYALGIGALTAIRMEIRRARSRLARQ